MDDVNIIICCKLRERVTTGCRPGTAGLTGAGIFIKLYGRNGKVGRKRELAAAARGRRDMRAMITDFHARLPANIPEDGEITCADRRYALRLETNIVLAGKCLRERIAKVRART